MYTVVRLIKGTHSMDVFPYSILIVIFLPKLNQNLIKPDLEQVCRVFAYIKPYSAETLTPNLSVLFSNLHDTTFSFQQILMAKIKLGPVSKRLAS